MIYKAYYKRDWFEIQMESDGKVLTVLYFKSQLNENIDLNLPIFKLTRKWLDLYFSGIIPNFTPPYKILNATSFRLDVLEEVSKIPYCKVVSYNDIRNLVMKKRNMNKLSPQAVASAIKWNPLLIIIPCHRVVGKDFNLTGYSGGISNKRALLALEGNDMKKFYYKDKSNE